MRFFWSDTWWIFNEYWLPTLKESRNQIPTHIHKQSNAMFCSPLFDTHKLLTHLHLYTQAYTMTWISYEYVYNHHFDVKIFFWILSLYNVFYYFFGAIQHLMWDLIIDDYWWRIFIVIHWKKYFRIKEPRRIGKNYFKNVGYPKNLDRTFFLTDITKNDS